MKVIRESKNTDGDIDILVNSLEDAKLLYLKKNFSYSPNLGKETGFFMKKLTINSLINYHIQDKIFFIYKRKLIVIKGFEKLILNSDKNYDYMLYVMKIFYEKKIKKRYIVYLENHYNIPFDKIDLSLEIDKFIQENRLQVVDSNIKYRYWLKKIKRLKFFSYPRFIGITGLDGSGKSTVVSKLEEIMQHNSEVVYMGKKEWETKLANTFLLEKKLPSILNVLILYFEFWYRFLKTFRSTKVVILDRHPSEMYLTQLGIRRKVYYLLFNILYPKANKTFYLHCSVKTALDRKNDIDDIDDYKKRKKMFDKHYKNSIWINTEENSLNQTIEIIIENLNPKTMELL